MRLWLLGTARLGRCDAPRGDAERDHPGTDLDGTHRLVVVPMTAGLAQLSRTTETGLTRIFITVLLLGLEWGS